MGIFFIILAALLDIAANLMLKKSNGFQNKFYGILALLEVVCAFIALSFAIKTIPLSVAYASWGALGIIGTIIGGYFLFGEKLNKKGIFGIFCILCAIVLL
ncbi:SMR family transporter, partial [Helicobacter sp. faydin-H20]|uniref:SMR family transporter n=1 Tax=Helicobacter anatolicus TaxID=2905874 RepID=UPI001E427189